MVSKASEIAELRTRYAHEIMTWSREQGRDNPRVETAFASVPREAFLTPPPWRIFAPGGVMDAETSDPAKLYADVLVVLDRAKGINNGQPSLHAAWLSAVDPQPGDTVVQIGIGAGYYTAILAELVGPEGRVEAYEIDERLAGIARANLSALRSVRVSASSALDAVLPRADIVYVSAGVAAPPAAWLRSLTPGGRLICPWQPAPHSGRTLFVRRTERGFSAGLFADVSFVGCVGAGPRDMRSRGMPSQRIDATRSVMLTADRPPDETSTAIYEDVWFSSQDVS